MPVQDQLDLLDFTANISESIISEYKLQPVPVRKYASRLSRSNDVEDTGIGADSTGATGSFAPVLARVLGREYSFAPVPFGYYIGYTRSLHAYILKATS